MRGMSMSPGGYRMSPLTNVHPVQVGGQIFLRGYMRGKAIQAGPYSVGEMADIIRKRKEAKGVPWRL